MRWDERTRRKLKTILLRDYLDPRKVAKHELYLDHIPVVDHLIVHYSPTRYGRLYRIDFQIKKNYTLKKLC